MRSSSHKSLEDLISPPAGEVTGLLNDLPGGAAAALGVVLGGRYAVVCLVITE